MAIPQTNDYTHKMNNSPYPVAKNGVYPLIIDSLAFGGKGVARIDDYVIFVKRAIPGDKINGRIIKRKKSYAEAVIDSFIEKSAQRIKAPCVHFEYCGGCSWQNMHYTDQLGYKTQIVKDAFRNFPGLKSDAIKPIIPSSDFFHYRNKMEFSFAERKWLTEEDLNNPDVSKDFALGLHVPGTFDKIIHIEECLLQSDRANAILKYVSAYTQAKKMLPYGLRTHKGLLRFLVIRESALTKKVMVNIVSSEKADALRKLAENLIKEFDFISGVVNNINSAKAQIAVGQKEILLAGKPFIEDEIGPFKFQISANSFFQTNTRQAKVLYDKVLEYAQLTADETAWDLYCGTGTISLFLASVCKYVSGFELAESAVQNAISNAKTYGFQNTRFIAGDVINNMSVQGSKPHIIITDPPRSGMHEKVVHAIMDIKPLKIVYVSCNPTTLERDLNILSDKYTIDMIQPVDMFPQTYHIECVTRLTLK